jgi:hypothetical protein
MDLKPDKEREKRGDIGLISARILGIFPNEVNHNCKTELLRRLKI